MNKKHKKNHYIKFQETLNIHIIEEKDIRQNCHVLYVKMNLN